MKTKTQMLKEIWKENPTMKWVTILIIILSAIGLYLSPMSFLMGFAPAFIIGTIFFSLQSRI